MINVKSEIGVLKKVLLHRPGKELLNLTPDTLEELLFDDIPYLKGARQEHDIFAKVLKDEGVEVVYLEDLMGEVLKDDEVKDAFLRQYIAEGGIRTKRYQAIIYKHLSSISDPKELVLKTMEGVNLNELDRGVYNSLVDLISLQSKMVIAPMPNLYFTRDPFAAIGNGITLNRMYSKTRSRETIYGEYIFKYHKDYKDTKKYYDRYDHFSIEGGDILDLDENTLAIGISQRTEPDAIELLSKRLFKESGIKKVLAFYIPKSRAFMHLDTVFTQVDYGTFCIHPKILATLSIFKIEDAPRGVKIKRLDGCLEDILKRELRRDDIRLIRCGGNDHITAEREQWSDGSNTLCIRPGVVICYERNDVTNAILEENGLKVIKIPSGELSRGRGGPRCMSMPLIRDGA